MLFASPREDNVKGRSPVHRLLLQNDKEGFLDKAIGRVVCIASCSLSPACSTGGLASGEGRIGSGPRICSEIDNCGELIKV